MKAEKVSGQDAVRVIKKQIMLKSIRVQYVALTLLETTDARLGSGQQVSVESRGRGSGLSQGDAWDLR